MIPGFASTLVLFGVIDLLYAVPLVLVVSLVYAATRQELMEPILRHAGKTAIWIAAFMLGVFILLWFLSSLV